MGNAAVVQVIEIVVWAIEIAPVWLPAERPPARTQYSSTKALASLWDGRSAKGSQARLELVEGSIAHSLSGANENQICASIIASVSEKEFHPQLLPAQRTSMIPLMLAAIASHNSVRTLLL